MGGFIVLGSLCEALKRTETLKPQSERSETGFCFEHLPPESIHHKVDLVALTSWLLSCSRLDELPIPKETLPEQHMQ
jgi:hypothetical protein